METLLTIIIGVGMSALGVLTLRFIMQRFAPPTLPRVTWEERKANRRHLYSSGMQVDETITIMVPVIDARRERNGGA